MRWPAILVVGALVSGAAHAAEPFQVVELPLPKAVARPQALRLKVTAGALPRGALLFVTTGDGRLVGTVAPSGTMQAGLQYELPLPAGAANGATVRLHLQMRTPGGALRAPAANEVLGLSLAYVPITD